MKQRIIIALLISALITIPLFAQEEEGSSETLLNDAAELSFAEETTAEATEEVAAEATEEAAAEAAVAADNEYEIPDHIMNNVFYLESLRLTQLAHEAFEYGDYDASTGFAEEAVLFAQRSDEFVSNQLIIEAGRLFEWADSNDVENKHPEEYSEGKAHYDASIEASNNENWSESIVSAISSIRIMAVFESGSSGRTALPAQYTVRPWVTSGDSFSEIAGYSFIYGDPYKWRIIYDANKSKLRDPNNPHLIHPGTVLDIPNLDGENRQGMWSE